MKSDEQYAPDFKHGDEARQLLVKREPERSGTELNFVGGADAAMAAVPVVWRMIRDVAG